jgi:hypothetical protein
MCLNSYIGCNGRNALERGSVVIMTNGFSHNKQAIMSLIKAISSSITPLRGMVAVLTNARYFCSNSQGLMPGQRYACRKEVIIA